MPRYEDADDGWRIVYVPAEIMTSYYRGLTSVGLFQGTTEVFGHAFYRSSECTHSGVYNVGFNLPLCYGVGVWNVSTTTEWPSILYLGGQIDKDYDNPVYDGYNYWGNIDIMVFDHFDPSTIINPTPYNQSVFPNTGWQTSNGLNPYYPVDSYIPPANGFQDLISQGPIKVEFVENGTTTRQWCTGARGVFQRGRVNGSFAPSSTRLEILSTTDAVLDTYILDGYAGGGATWTAHEDTGILQTWPIVPIGSDGNPDWIRYDGDGTNGVRSKSAGSIGFKYTGRCAGFRLSKMSARWYYQTPSTLFLHEFGKRTVGEGPPQRMNQRNDGNGVNDKSARFRNLYSSNVSSRQSSNRLNTGNSLYE
jgi:hypothetical protein